MEWGCLLLVNVNVSAPQKEEWELNNGCSQVAREKSRNCFLLSMNLVYLHEQSCLYGEIMTINKRNDVY